MQDGYSLAYGARFLKRVIEDRIKLPISQRWTEGTHFVADVRDGKIADRCLDGDGGYRARRNRLSSATQLQTKVACSGVSSDSAAASLRDPAARRIDVARRADVVALSQRVDQSRGPCST